ncbi:MFS transporter [Coxiella-like endosymbiont]|uniref:MFS transporter n=1 Tax=Coxiella-like endosymbiont TaxID=1592897 RepID=UPI00272D30E4|nr:MFS transporter [Coxiella-like endosymbiont]
MAAAYIDRIGRKSLQMFRFLIITIAYGLIALIFNVVNNVPLFTVVFGISFFFVNVGHNTTIFLIPSEVYPTTLWA